MFNMYDSFPLTCHVFLHGEGSGPGDDDDEDNDYCGDGSYLCSNSMECMPESTLCDGINDCGDWQDESASLCGSKLSSYLCINYFSD